MFKRKRCKCASRIQLILSVAIQPNTFCFICFLFCPIKANSKGLFIFLETEPSSAAPLGPPHSKGSPRRSQRPPEIHRKSFRSTTEGLIHFVVYPKLAWSVRGALYRRQDTPGSSSDSPHARKCNKNQLFFNDFGSAARAAEELPRDTQGSSRPPREPL